MLPELIRYTEIADSLVINTFLAAERSLPQAEALFSHVLNAQHIWISRINGEQPLYERFSVHPVSFFAELHSMNVLQLKQILKDENMNRPVNYSTSTGESFEDSISDILLQVVNHSTYHRAQVASCLKQSGIQPPMTDFIHLKRQGML